MAVIAMSNVPAFENVVDYPDELQEGDDRRWIVLFEEDYDNLIVDVDDRVGILVDIEQTGEVLRLAAQTLAALSHQDADGEDVIRDMIDALEEVADAE